MKRAATYRGCSGANGKTAVHTGTDAALADWAGSRTGDGFSIQGNGLASPQVLAAMERASTWPRACVLAVEVAVEIEAPELALRYLTLAFERNPARIPVVLGGGTFALLGAEPRFHRWATPALQENALARFRAEPARANVSAAERSAAARRLLEAGYATEALAVLRETTPEGSSPDYFLARATAHAALNDLTAALTDCESGLKNNPGDARLLLCLARLQQLSKGTP